MQPLSTNRGVRACVRARDIPLRSFCFVNVILSFSLLASSHGSGEFRAFAPYAGG